MNDDYWPPLLSGSDVLSVTRPEQGLGAGLVCARAAVVARLWQCAGMAGDRAGEPGRAPRRRHAMPCNATAHTSAAAHVSRSRLGGRRPSCSPWHMVFARLVQRRASCRSSRCLPFRLAGRPLNILSEVAVAERHLWGASHTATMSAPILIQSASLFGFYAVTFLICLFANTLAMALQGRQRNTAVAVGLGLPQSAQRISCSGSSGWRTRSLERNHARGRQLSMRRL